MTEVLERQDLYRQHQATIAARTDQPDWLKARREQAMARFEELGFPHGRQEAWRFSTPKKIARNDYGLLPQATPSNPAIHQLEGEHPCLVFVNGHYQADLSRTADLEGVTLLPMADAISQDQPELKTVLDREESESMPVLNQALFEGGVFLHVSVGVELELPIEFVYLTLSQEGGASFPHSVIIAEAKSRFTVVENFADEGDSGYMTNSVVDIQLGTNASVDHYFKENGNESAKHLRTLRVVQDAASSFNSHSLLLGGAIVRNDVRISFQGEGAKALVNGCFISHESQLHDYHITVDHAVPNCVSDQIIRGVLDGKSRGVFCGRVIVREHAQKTDSRQSNRNLLLSGDARVDAQPQLEIYADDVKCAHGATTGQLDEDALFYMQARGIDPDTAKDLLTYAFAHEVIEGMPLEPFRRRAEAFLFERFATARMLEEGS